MTRRLPSRTLSALAIAAFCLTPTCVPLISAAPVPVSAHKKHHAAASGHAGTGKRTIQPTAKGKATRSRSRSSVHAFAGPRLAPERRAALIERIGDDLRAPASQTIAYASALNGFYAQLEAHQSESSQTGQAGTEQPDLGAAAASQSETLRVLQFGDSHTAADMFTGEARRVFQEQFGNGGIGYSYAGHPFAGYRILGSARSQSEGWITQGNKFTHLGNGETGLGGISISTDRAGERVTLDAPCDTLELQYLQQPGGGGLRFTDNSSVPVEIQTDAPDIGPGTYKYTCPAGDHHFEVTTDQNAPVTLLGWVATQPGVTWESIGINGAEAPLILKWDQALFSSYLKDNSPALVVLAYGTNEAAGSFWDEETYAQAFALIVDTIHQYVPTASILVVGPPDRSTAQHRAWHPYLGTDRIIQAQRAVCRTHGCAYWDQRQRMGGLGAMQQWVGIGWAQADHTHFTGEGYRALADALIADLIAGYQAYKQRNPIAAQGATDGAASSNR